MLHASLFEASMTGTLCEHDHAIAVFAGSDDVLYYPHFFPRIEADRYFSALLGAAWKQEQFSIYGRSVPMPRLTAWYGDPGATYTYSKIVNEPLPWRPELLEILADLESFSGVRFNSVLLNRYRDGSDSISWHADDEPELGAEPIIASISLGAARTFQFRSRSDRRVAGSVLLEHGSLLLMKGDSQRMYQHAIPKERRIVGERVNLTFRVVRAGRAAKKDL